ncbi:kallikrein-7-like [Phyllostomus hastatus]|uniref:kallikrein-7-like n=1 Tax=Phyllostomus hastatus TaxID=9423 RepID=UPI001E680D16|nr:kallikrein-7-like [Phyllostomus hastatus]
MASPRLSPLLILLLSLALGAAGQGANNNNGENIVNGSPCPRSSQPWQVALLHDSEFHCSGVLVSEQWVLTVAQCNRSEYTVHMGSDLLDDKNAVRIRATESFIHPRFHSQKYIHDFMLVKLSSPAPLSETVRKVTLPSRCRRPGAHCTFSGWDNMDTNLVTQPSALQCSNVTLISHKDCGKLHSIRPKTHMMCTTAPAGTFAYRGDSGSPLMCGGSLQGLVSRGYVPSTEPPDPVVYTPLYWNHKWIHEIIEGNS